MTDFKPGTVAVATVRGVENIRVVRIGPDSHDAWYVPVSTPGTHLGYYTTAAVTDVRPLVVLDPEDDEQIQALYDAYYHSGGLTFGGMAKALRSLARPPKPAEPRGLGAVVEDAEGNHWVRADSEEPQWLMQHKIDSHWCKWDRVTAVRILNDGVTA